MTKKLPSHEGSFFYHNERRNINKNKHLFILKYNIIFAFSIDKFNIMVYNIYIKLAGFKIYSKGY